MDPYPHLNAPAEGYVFVVTYGRSGSTLLQMLLNDIPGYCIRGENANTLYHLFQATHVFHTTDSIRGLRHRGTPTASHQPWYGIEEVAPRGYARALADVFVRDVLRLPAGTRVGGFKEIRFHVTGARLGEYLRFIDRSFPNARFVINTRDLAAVARSSWWARMPAEEVAALLRPAERAFAAFAAQVPGRAIGVHYDDYVADAGALGPLYDFLGEPFDAAAVARRMAQRLDHARG